MWLLVGIERRGLKQWHKSLRFYCVVLGWLPLKQSQRQGFWGVWKKWVGKARSNRWGELSRDELHWNLVLAGPSGKLWATAVHSQSHPEPEGSHLFLYARQSLGARCPTLHPWGGANLEAETHLAKGSALWKEAGMSPQGSTGSWVL